MTMNDNDLTRRKFVRKVGAGLISITVVDLLFGKSRLAFACGEGTTDSACGIKQSDANCSVPSGNTMADSDNNCGLKLENSNDFSCGTSTTGGSVSGPLRTDTDEACSDAVSDSDDNCGISYNPTPAVDKDNSCNQNGIDADQSCGDCNDDHETDDHCGEQAESGKMDADELCGHQHVVSGTTDSVCSNTEPDVGCGTHSNDYAYFNFTDTDQYCSGTSQQPDQNCSGLDSDANCNSAYSPSSTSPDENCSVTDEDAACSLYDRDESCGSGSRDEACGVTTINNESASPLNQYLNINWPDETDSDANCGARLNSNALLDPDSQWIFPCPLGGG